MDSAIFLYRCNRSCHSIVTGPNFKKEAIYQFGTWVGACVGGLTTAAVFDSTPELQVVGSIVGSFVMFRFEDDIA